jgi:hypothetical protein
MKLFIQTDGLEPIIIENVELGKNPGNGIGEIRLVGNSKVKSVKQIAPIDVEKIATIREFVSTCLGENRLEQGIFKLGEMGLDATDNKNTGAYIKWCVDDVFREERDTIVESQLDVKILGKELSTVARNYFLNRPI